MAIGQALSQTKGKAEGRRIDQANQDAGFAVFQNDETEIGFTFLGFGIFNDLVFCEVCHVLAAPVYAKQILHIRAERKRKMLGSGQLFFASPIAPVDYMQYNVCIAASKQENKYAYHQSRLSDRRQQGGR